MFEAARAASRRIPIPIKWVLRVVVSGLLLTVILSVLPTDQIWVAIRSLPLWLWVAVLALFLVGHVVAAIKWSLLALRGSGTPMLAVLEAHFAGLAANLCLPGIAGGDVMRAALVMRGRDDRTPIALGSLLDRLLDILALLLLAGLGALLALERDAWPGGLLSSVALVFLGAVGVLALVAILLPRLPSTALTMKLAEATAAFARRPGRLAACLGLSLLVQAGFVGLNILLARATGLDAPAAGWLFAWPLAKLIAVMPISLGGLGVREASLATLMASVGASPAKVVAVGLLWQSVLVAAGLIGALALLLARRAARPASGAISPEGCPEGSPQAGCPEAGPAAAGVPPAGQPRRGQLAARSQ